jgi:hypothetical protein
MNRQQQIDHFVASAHALAFQRLREQPGLVDKARAQLQRWRAAAGETRSDGLWDKWERLLDRPVADMERELGGNTDRAVELRSVSPLSVLITQAERAQFISQARQAT